jgi:ATP-dependent DNA helicase RecQ
VLPTGSGKSAIYQVAALAGLAPALVVSPLIALEHDQLRSLEEAGVAGAAELHSALPPGQQGEVVERFAAGGLDFLFLTPEQLADPALAARLEEGRPRLLVVDEAHCVSEWGHQYRPDYLALADAAAALGGPRVLALTATASPPVRSDIVARLRLRDPAVVVRGFDRPNIFLGVRNLSHKRERRAALLDRLGRLAGDGIVYTDTRRGSEELAAELRARGLDARHYHGGLGRRERESVHEEFLAGSCRVVVATIAFGMGVDKPDVRFVLHLGLPESVDAYYQQLGRAGRDGEPATAELFHVPADAGGSRFRAGAASFDLQELRLVAAALGAATGKAGEVVVDGVPSARVRRMADRLLEAGGSPEAAAALQERYREMQRTRAEMMQGYAELEDCRRRYLLQYFGEPLEASCGNCDACLAGRAVEASGGPLAIGERVSHREWGAGTVIRREPEAVVVLFEEGGYRRLDVGLALENGLLEPA